MTDPAFLLAVGAAAGTSFTALGLYFTARRKASGKIDTTEAAVLWQEAKAMRLELRDEVIDLRKQLITAQKEIAKLRERVTVLEPDDE